MNNGNIIFVNNQFCKSRPEVMGNGDFSFVAFYRTHKLVIANQLKVGRGQIDLFEVKLEVKLWPSYCIITSLRNFLII